MIDYKVVELNDETIHSIQKLADEATDEGHSLAQRTIDEWQSGKNRFSKPSEKFWGISIDNEIVGIGGLNEDPYADDPSVGRVRHVYILKKYRGLGLSKVLMRLILDRAKHYFKTLRVSTTNPIASSLYESFGFEKSEGPKVTHILKNLNG